MIIREFYQLNFILTMIIIFYNDNIIAEIIPLISKIESKVRRLTRPSTSRFAISSPARSPVDTFIPKTIGRSRVLPKDSPKMLTSENPPKKRGRGRPRLSERSNRTISETSNSSLLETLIESDAEDEEPPTKRQKLRRTSRSSQGSTGIKTTSDALSYGHIYVICIRINRIHFYNRIIDETVFIRNIKNFTKNLIESISF